MILDKEELKCTNVNYTFKSIIATLKEKEKMNLCFLGNSSYEKEKLAQCIADELKMPILIKSAYELLENKLELYRFFEIAENEGTIIFLNDCDLFFKDRRLATSLWSVKIINNFLNSIKKFKGILITSISIVEKLDIEVLKNFDFKIKFLELNNNQKWDIFCEKNNILTNELEEDPNYPQDQFPEKKYLRKRLEEIDRLNMDDFINVERGLKMIHPDFSPRTFLNELILESKFKD